MARGRPATPIEVLKARGSRTLRLRKPKVEPLTERKPRARKIGDLAEVIRGIPGFDPHRNAAGYRFDEARATKAIQFIERLRHSKGELAGKPFRLELWQRAIVANVFGWVSQDGTRRFRECFLFLPRKNGKSSLAAGIILFLLFADGEPCAEVFGAASEFQQACLIFSYAAGMVRQDPDLSERCKLYLGQAKSIQVKSDWSTYRCVSREATSQHGFNAHGVIIDEVHCLPDAELIEALQTSTGARRQPLTLLVSTSDYEREGSPCNAKHDYASKVRDGVINDARFLPCIWEASIDDDWTSPQVWAKANPNLGISVSREYLERECQRAKDTPTYENTFKRLHLNIRTAQDVRWLPLEAWDKCQGDDIHESQFNGKECWAGLDLASSRDLTAFVAAFPIGDDRVALIPHFWIPRDTALAREKADRVPYLTWIQQEWITATEGNVCDYAKVCADILALSKRFNVQELAIDRLFQGDSVGQQLQAEGLNVVSHGQGFASMAAPTKRFEELVLGAKIWHGGNPVLRWHASNVSVELDAAGNLKPSRKKSTEKIDGIVAAIMAVGRLAGRERNVNIYETRGLLVL